MIKRHSCAAILPEDAGSGDAGDEISSRDLICLLPNVSRMHATPQNWDTHAPAVAVFMSIFFVVALVWNSFIIYSMVRARSKLLRAPTHVVLLTLGAHAQRGLYYFVCHSVRPSVCPSVCLLPRFLPLRATRRAKNDTNGLSATLALFLRCAIRRKRAPLGM